MSPNGKYISWSAPVRGVMNIWVRGVADDEFAAKPAGTGTAARAITNGTDRPITRHVWSADSKYILYFQDDDGDENFGIYRADVATGESKVLVKAPDVAAQLIHVSDKHPESILVGLNDRNPQYHDVYRVELATGKKTLLYQNDKFAGLTPDDDYVLRVAMAPRPDGGLDMFSRGPDVIATPAAPAATAAKPTVATKPAPVDAINWQPLLTIPQADANTTGIEGITPDGQFAYFVDSRGRDTAGLYLLSLADKSSKLIGSNPKADISDAMTHPKTGVIEAYATEYEKPEWKVLDKGVDAELKAIRKSLAAAGASIDVASRSQDDKLWVIHASSDIDPGSYWLWSREHKRGLKLGDIMPKLAAAPLSRMHPVIIKARDGLPLVSYLSVPRAADPKQVGKPKSPQPLVLLVHGGPWARDSWGFDNLTQLLTNRGYAVLQVNFRGSTGFGKGFINAADKQWGKAMHTDLLDAVAWAQKGGIADPKKVCIMGGSYGGYATLAGLTLTPDAFACGVDIVGPSNLVTLVQSIPAYWAPMIAVFKTRINDWTTPEGKQAMLDVSPITHVKAIKRPLLIAQGANDPRVKQAESDSIVAAMQANAIPVSYVLFPDEGHGFRRPENNQAFFAIAEAFLAAHLGGTFQPMMPAEWNNSSATMPVGPEGIPGLRDAVK
ncbi:MAG: S9 family peptidase [Myxococcales bacterium]|nr:S9 family peptidase [Myxococcales bacterium]